MSIVLEKLDKVILVDENDQKIGTMEKLEAHKKGLLHRAFSILIFNEKGEMLIHRRAESKYHSGGLWTNACCSHPSPGESLSHATERRLQEELGFVCQLKPLYSFIYRVDFGDGLTENELDHVFIGNYEGDIHPNPLEVAEWKYIPMEELQGDIAEHPEHYTHWFKLIMKELPSKLK